MPVDTHAAALVHRRMQQCASSLDGFVREVNRIRPRAHVVFELPGVPAFDGLSVGDLFLEERRSGRPGFLDSSFADSTITHYEYLLLSFEYRGPQVHTVVRESPPEIERLESQLHLHRIRFDMDVQRNARAQVGRAVFRIRSEIAAGVKAIPDYERGVVRFVLRNLGRLGTSEAHFRAQDLTQPVLDELTRCVAGLPNDLMRAATASTGAGSVGAPGTSTAPRFHR